MPTGPTPSTRGVIICDFCVGYSNGTVDLYGVFNRITSPVFPIVRDRICVYAQLSDSEGDVPFYVNLRDAADDRLVFTSQPQVLHFEDRLSVTHMAYTIEDCRIPRAGVYLIELLCNNELVADTRVTMLRQDIGS